MAQNNHDMIKGVCREIATTETERGRGTPKNYV